MEKFLQSSCSLNVCVPIALVCLLADETRRRFFLPPSHDALRSVAALPTCCFCAMLCWDVHRASDLCAVKLRKSICAIFYSSSEHCVPWNKNAFVRSLCCVHITPPDGAVESRFTNTSCKILSSLFHPVSLNITSTQCTTKQSSAIFFPPFKNIISINASYKWLFPLELICIALAVVRFDLVEWSLWGCFFLSGR